MFEPQLSALPIRNNMNNLIHVCKLRDAKIEHRVMRWTRDKHVVADVETSVWAAEWSDMVNL